MAAATSTFDFRAKRCACEDDSEFGEVDMHHWSKPCFSCGAPSSRFEYDLDHDCTSQCGCRDMAVFCTSCKKKLLPPRGNGWCAMVRDAAAQAKGQTMCIVAGCRKVRPRWAQDDPGHLVEGPDAWALYYCSKACGTRDGYQ